MPVKEKHRPQRVPADGAFEKEEALLWRAALLSLLLLAAVLWALSWGRLEALPIPLRIVPLALLSASFCFAGLAYRRRKRVSELQELIRGLRESSSGPSEQQLDQLGQVISRSQRSFRELIDSIGDLAFALSLDGKLRTVNRRVSELLAIPYRDVVGHSLDEFLEEPQAADVESAMARFLKQRRWSGVVRARLKTSSRVLYLDCVVNAIVKDEEVVGVSVLARDVTEDLEKERRFAELFETLQEGVYFSSPEGKLLDVNPALVEVLGYANKAELLSLDHFGLNSQPDQSPALGRGSGDQGGVRTREISLRRKDGSEALFLDSSRAVWDATGKIIRYQGTLVDVTERRVMEKVLRRQEEFRRYLLESFPDLILVVDLEERYSFVSSRIRDLLGYQPEDLLGKKMEEVEDHSPEFITLYRDVSSGRKRFGLCEYHARHRDENWRTMRATASPLHDAHNQLNGVIVSVRDITIERKLEQQIIQSERLAAMGQMVGGFAHELNNPLTSIMGLSEMLQDLDVGDVARKQLATLHQQSRRAAEIVQNLTYFSRPPLQGRSSIQLSDLMQRTLHLHAYSLRKNNITVEFLPGQSLPVIDGDPHQLMQVFLNLIVNAEQAMRELRDRGKLRIRILRDGSVDFHLLSGRRSRHSARNLAQYLRPFLHNQTARTRHRARLEHLQGDLARARRERGGKFSRRGWSKFCRHPAPSDRQVSAAHGPTSMPSPSRQPGLIAQLPWLPHFRLPNTGPLCPGARLSGSSRRSG
jgi:PAS domain S-box-containing protein